jgi:predicted ATP-grasp superfamily ATP-dependent carboligase
MLDPSEIYEVDEQVAADLVRGTEELTGTGPVLLHAVSGFVDAGGAGQVAVDHVQDRFPFRRLATFDVDQLVDYRSRRPVMVFDATTWASYADPELVVDVVSDASGRPFLLLHGTEPDFQWERYVAAVRQLVERFDVPLTVGIHGIPMGIPHTRPLSVTAHGTRPELVADYSSWFGTAQVPASSSALLELRLGQSGHDAMGFAVHVPHYLAQSAFPQASVTALQAVQRATGLELDTPALEKAAADALEEIDRQVESSVEIGAVVRALEEQYDSFTRGGTRSNLLSDTTALPTADELGEQFEQFLAQQGENGPAH